MEEGFWVLGGSDIILAGGRVGGETRTRLGREFRPRYVREMCNRYVIDNIAG